MTKLIQYLQSMANQLSHVINLRGRSSRLPKEGKTGALLAILFGLVFLFANGGPLFNYSYDLPYLLRGKIDVSTNDACCVYMDLFSQEALGQPRQAQWNRAVHAGLLDYLRDCDAKVVVFDILFLQPDGDNPAADAALVDAIKAHGRVVVGSLFVPDFIDGQLMSKGVLKGPMQSIANVATVGLTQAGDESVRKHFFDFHWHAPGMAHKTAELAHPELDLKPYAPRWMNYYGPAGTIPGYSYIDVLNAATNTTIREVNLISNATFSNKVVFVGARYNIAYTGGFVRIDEFATPFTLMEGTKSPGVEINATAYLNLVRGDWLTELAPTKEAILLTLCGLIFGLLFGVTRPVTTVVVAVVSALLVAFLATILVWQTRVWFPWLIVSGVQIPVAAGCSLLVHARNLLTENKLLERRLALANAGGHAEIAEIGAIPAMPTPSPEGVPPVDPRAHTVTHDTPDIPDHKLLSVIGEGAYGEIWLAQDILGSFHAVKVVYRDHLPGEEPYQREFKGVRNFTPISRSHPGFVHILHVGQRPTPRCFYSIMEVADDEDTGQHIDPKNYSPRTLAREIKKRKRLPIAEAIEVGLQLADALDSLHKRNLIHRDIKPANIIFVEGAAKLADIGLVTEIATQHSDVSYLGTYHYIAPEGPGKPPADVFSLGKVMYEATFGLSATRFPEIPTDMVNAPDGDVLIRLNRIVLRACEERPERRYQTAGEVRAALLELKGLVSA